MSNDSYRTSHPTTSKLAISMHMFIEQEIHVMACILIMLFHGGKNA